MTPHQFPWVRNLAAIDSHVWPCLPANILFNFVPDYLLESPVESSLSLASSGVSPGSGGVGLTFGDFGSLFRRLACRANVHHLVEHIEPEWGAKGGGHGG